MSPDGMVQDVPVGSFLGGWAYGIVATWPVFAIHGVEG